MEPNTPQNLEELVSANIPILTMSRSLVWLSHEKKLDVISLLMTFVIPDLAAFTSSQKRKTYIRLKNKTQFLPETSFEVAKNLSTYGFIGGARNPEMIALVDSSDYFMSFRKSLTLFERYKPSSQHHAMHFYIHRSLWFVEKNVFAKIFITGLTCLAEGGIMQRWVSNVRVAKVEMKAYVAFKEMKKLKLNSVERQSAQPTTLKQVRVPFVLQFGMLFGSMGIFVYEIRLNFKILLCFLYFRILFKFSNFASRFHFF